MKGVAELQFPLVLAGSPVDALGAALGDLKERDVLPLHLL